MTDLTNLEILLEKNNTLLLHTYVAQLWIIGVVSAIAVCYLLYKFLRKFF